MSLVQVPAGIVLAAPIDDPLPSSRFLSALRCSIPSRWSSRANKFIATSQISQVQDTTGGPSGVWSEAAAVFSARSFRTCCKLMRWLSRVKMLNVSSQVLQVQSIGEGSVSVSMIGMRKRGEERRGEEKGRVSIYRFCWWPEPRILRRGWRT